jgi:hypothetical protein
VKSKGKRQISKIKRAALSFDFVFEKLVQPSEQTFAFCLLRFAF